MKIIVGILLGIFLEYHFKIIDFAVYTIDNYENKIEQPLNI